MASAKQNLNQNSCSLCDIKYLFKIIHQVTENYKIINRHNNCLDQLCVKRFFTLYRQCKDV